MSTVLDSIGSIGMLIVMLVVFALVVEDAEAEVRRFIATEQD